MSVLWAPCQAATNPTPSFAPGDCLAGVPSEQVHISYVTDGDTVVLSDKRRVRLIGLNALELNASSKADLRWAVEARTALKDWIQSGPVRLIPGIDRIDHFGRTLAHLQKEGGSIAAQTLIQKGLALSVAVGANTRCADQMLLTERQARSAGLGIWASPGNWLINKERLNGRERGFNLIESVVVGTSKNTHHEFLTLANGLQVHFDEHWKKTPANATLLSSRIVGKKFEVRGWLNSNNGKQRLTISHPANLRVLIH